MGAMVEAMVDNRPARHNALEIKKVAISDHYCSDYCSDDTQRSGFYLHKLFGWQGFGFFSTQTFRVAGVWILSTISTQIVGVVF